MATEEFTALLDVEGAFEEAASATAAEVKEKVIV
jgi:hypothetical protein